MPEPHDDILSARDVYGSSTVDPRLCGPECAPGELVSKGVRPMLGIRPFVSVSTFKNKPTVTVGVKGEF